MNEPAREGRWSAGAVLGVVLALVVVWDAWSLVRHSGFQPVSWLRIAAPLVALAIGGAYTRALANARAHADAEREFDRGGKALFMGLVMVTATLLAWLLVSQALPATWTALAGTPRSEQGVVTRRVPETTDADCRFRLEVTSAATAAGAVPRSLDECVDEALWKRAAEGGAVSLQLVAGVLGAELVGVSAP